MGRKKAVVPEMVKQTTKTLVLNEHQAKALEATLVDVQTRTAELEKARSIQAVVIAALGIDPTTATNYDQPTKTLSYLDKAV